MIRIRSFGLLLLAALLFSGMPVFAQDKKGGELLQPIQPDKPKGPEKLMLYSGEYLKVQLYGFIKFDMVYNSTDVVNESGPFWVTNQVVYFNPTTLAPAVPTNSQKLLTLKKTPSQRSGSFLMDMRSTRLGIKITGPKVLLADTMALVEIDFWGTAAASGTGERSGMPMMRHAYAQLNWATGTSFLIGQSWSLAMAMPAQPLTVTYVPFGQNGNLFQREPQIMLGQKIGNDKYNVTIEVAMARAMGGSDTGVASDLYPGVNGVEPDERGPGEASKFPGGRARLTFVMKPHDMVNITLGGSGHYQLEKHALAYNGAVYFGWIPAAIQPSFLQRFGRMTRSYSAQAFTKIQASLVTLVATYWRGNNMDTFFCGLGAGTAENFTSTKILGIPVQGGYAQVQIDLRKIGPIPLVFSAGYGGIKKNNKKIVALNTMLWNEAILANAFWYINDYLSAGFEFGRHQSKWKGALGSAIDYKYHTGVYFTF